MSANNRLEEPFEMKVKEYRGNELYIALSIRLGSRADFQLGLKELKSISYRQKRSPTLGPGSYLEYNTYRQQIL